MDYKDKIYKTLYELKKNKKKDMKSFTTFSKYGVVFVECRDIEIYIEYYFEGKKKQFCGNLLSCTNLLEKLEIDLFSLEI